MPIGAALTFNVLFQNKINILTEVAVVRFGQFLDFFDHFFIERDAYFGL